MPSAVVFAYHDVGVRCLSVLLAHGIDVRHVYTHADDPNETIWFGSVANLARQHDIPVTFMGSGKHPGLGKSVAAMQADFLFSFYYRYMLASEILALAPKGAFNIHGSLLPKYRGRVPVNWAIIHGEQETGATLHEMVAKPDAGRLVDQLAVPILPNDYAVDVFRKVTVAAEIVLHRSLPQLIDGTASLTIQNLSLGSYYGGRKADDGHIDWNWSAARVHNLIRAVAPPYPPAFCDVNGKRIHLCATIDTHQNTSGPVSLFAASDTLYIRCADGGTLKILSAVVDKQALTPKNINALLGASTLLLAN